MLEGMKKGKGVEALEVFKKSHKLVLDVYRITKEFPTGEKFGLITQMRRASTSIPANLIEGSERAGRLEYRRFVSIAKGSAGELKYYFLLAKDLGYISAEDYLPFRDQLDEVGKMLSGLVKSLSTAKE
ncbi:MAG TPA: four helix bundle protein [Thermodesulfobacteriota bacterium]|nr:four helix bundle protein [Thermodesulfobacteriota bacterium]